MTAVEDISIINTPRGFEVLPLYQVIYNGMLEGWDHASVKTLLVVFVYDVEFPREDISRILRLLDSMLLKLDLEGDVLELISEAREEPSYEKLRGILLAMDPRDIFALGW